MNELLNELLTSVLTEAPKKTGAPKKPFTSGAQKKPVVPPGLFAGSFGNYYSDQNLTKYAGKVKAGKWVPVSQEPEAGNSKGTSSPKKQPVVTKPAVPVQAKNVPQSKEVPLTKASGTTPPLPLLPKAASNDMKVLDILRNRIKTKQFDNEDHKTRTDGFVRLWQAFISAPSYEEQVKAVEALVDQNMIQGGVSGKKIYVHPNVGLPYKIMCGSGTGTSVTRLMNQIAKDAGIEIPPQDDSRGSAQADSSGKTNEAGVVAFLDPSKENQATYDTEKSRYGQLGGDVEAIDALNNSAADIIRSSLGAGAKITKCTQVGGVGEIRLKQLGIDPKVDPTDILLEYEVGGKKKAMKISAKIYSNPTRITMKNSGLVSAGKDYLGEPEGNAVDELWGKLWKKYKWTKDMSESEISTRKRKLREEYLKAYSTEMINLAKTAKGQQKLAEMWTKVHGCGKDVHTLIVDKRTGKSQLKAPAHYCSPSTPFKVKYNGIKVVIEMNSGSEESLEINLKTETSGGAKLLFNHVAKTSKSK